MRIYERTWVEIDLNALAHNTNEIRNHISNNVDIMAVVKADGYGHGALEVSKELLACGVTCLGVAVCDEGIALRNSNIKVPILLLGFTPEQRLRDVLLYNLVQTIYTYENAEQLSRAAVLYGKPTTVHVKVDTGMNRLGFEPNAQSVADIVAISKLPNITIGGIFSHLAQSDSSEHSFVYAQASVFSRFTRALTKAGVNVPFKHMSNSGAIISCDNLRMGMVRAGIMLYGLPPSGQVDLTGWELKPALQWKTQVAQCKHVKKGVSIGYGRTFYTRCDSKIATIPVGYADGFSRRLSNVGRVLIGGAFAPIVGLVCMDQMMVDVTHLPDVRVGDEVVLIGKQGERCITADDMALLLGTISYEVLCGISKRVPRIYLKDRCVFKTVNGIV